MLSSMETPRFESFEEFWPYYVKEHSNKANRILHFIGTTAAMACVAGGVLTKRRWLLALAPVVGYGHAWIGHFFIENNKPASFKYPLWSLRADYKMLWFALRGKMAAEVTRLYGSPAPRREAPLLVQR